MRGRRWLVEGGESLGLEDYRRSVSETKRAAILKAARRNFLIGGYSKAAMAEIARDADVSTATLYKHFSSKETLFRAVIEEAYGGIDERPIADVGDASAHEVLCSICRIYLRQQFEDQMNGLLRMVIGEVPTSPQLAQEVFTRGVTVRYRQFRKVLDALVARGDLVPHDTETSVRQLGGMVKEFIVWPALFTKDYRIPDDIEQTIDGCVGAYLTIHGRPAAARLAK
ncbi:MAG: TetR/AcrR family transcriptional regulator [Parvibaculum sp.]|uniref:TetR/AcrR family transcriptional regulator n=1 Tax=Parvibaculum sp. TaxID=2024848 RepID=UPI0032EF0BE1